MPTFTGTFTELKGMANGYATQYGLTGGASVGCANDFFAHQLSKSAMFGE